MPEVDSKSRNCRVYLKDLSAHAVELEVELHFRGNSGNAFREWRQSVLLAIASSLKRHGAKFAAR